ncbi:phage tail protein [Vibrio injensis]|uniref:phage tail protein n=1 Tax=Vibrio injensis TaxID=1307414 RepID=UPI00278C7AD5|nr:phage tail protein [Vibrio injensis]
MSEPNEFISVQPDNRTLIEESLEYAWDRILKQSTSPYPDLKNPMLTPDEFVVLLASERGVADWQPIDTELHQRRTVDKAFEIHSKAGTRAGLVSAVRAVGYDADIQAGHKLKDPIPYHVEILAWREPSDVVDEKKIARLVSRINAYKSERDTIEVAMTFATFVSLQAKSAAPRIIGITGISGRMQAMPQPEAFGSCYASMAGHSVSLSSIVAAAEIHQYSASARIAVRHSAIGKSLSVKQYNARAKL